MNLSDLFKCCIKKSGPLDNKYTKSSDSIDNVSMISVTYGLESFNKNAMLIFCQVTSEQGSRDRELALKEVAVLKTTFQKYRFEVETHVDLTSCEIEETCDKYIARHVSDSSGILPQARHPCEETIGGKRVGLYLIQKLFARNFTEYGAVAVVIMAPTGDSGTLSASDKNFDENVVVKYLTTEVPESLMGKPKIYITEANRNTTPVDGKMLYSLPIADNCEDILGLHIPSVIEGTPRSPLHIFCDRMTRAEDHGNLIGIVIGSIQEIEDSFPALKEKLELTCTFRKRLTLPIFILLA